MDNHFTNSNNFIRNYLIQKKSWIRFSIFFVILILLAILEWEQIMNLKYQPVQFFIFGFFIIVSVIWWYWTMSMIKKLLTMRQLEVKILEDLVKDINQVKKDIQNINQ